MRSFQRATNWMLAVLVTVLGAATPGLAQIKIMPIGDSITLGEGSTGEGGEVGGYRDDLAGLLNDAQINFDFAGALKNGVGFDADHEGHGGWRADQIEAEIGNFLNAAHPDVVLLHIGTNDVTQGQSNSNTIAEIESIVNAIHRFNNKITIAVSSLVPRTDSRDAKTTALNALIESLVTQKHNAGYRIVFVDNNRAFKANSNWEADYMHDNVHPNDAGYKVLAEVFFKAIPTSTSDDIAPAAIQDLAITNLSATTVSLAWTASGDDGNEGGPASHYDLRFSDAPLTEENFNQATAVTALPAPKDPGAEEFFDVSGLLPGATYYFAIKAGDETFSFSAISNVPAAKTAAGLLTKDDFNRDELGTDWNARPEIKIVDGELSNTTTEPSWNYMAVFNKRKNPIEVSYQWGVAADAAGISEGGFALMLDDASAAANGYLLFRRLSPPAGNPTVTLWTIINGAPAETISDVTATLPGPVVGDSVRVVLRSDNAGHHFSYFINGKLAAIVTDPQKRQGNAKTLYGGVMLRGNLHNNLDDFTVMTDPAGTVAVEEKSLAQPNTFELSQNYPNPFSQIPRFAGNPTTHILYNLPTVASVNLTIYNSLGQEVRKLVEARQQPGSHTVVWDGRDQSGRSLSSGMYYYRLSAGSFTASRKMLLVQ